MSEHESNTAMTDAPDLREWLVARVSEATRCKPEEIDTSTTFAALGMDSVSAVSFTCHLETHLGRKVSPDLLMEFDTIDDLIACLTRADHHEGHEEHEGRTKTSDGHSSTASCLRGSDSSEWFADLTQRVHRWKREGTFFYEPVLESVDGAWCVVGGRRLLMMASYSYLGLIGHPRINEAASDAIQRFGTGVNATRLIGGTTGIHVQLEARIAAFNATQAAIVYTAGFMTNLSTIATLVGPGDRVIGDVLNHASIADGCKFSGAESVTFPHNDMAALERLLRGGRDRSGGPPQGVCDPSNRPSLETASADSEVGRYEAHRRDAGATNRGATSAGTTRAATTAGATNGRRTLVVVDAVYSMDGDIAPLPEIARLCREYGALLMVDEAHSIGVLGATGRGITEHFGLPPATIDIHMGTLSKAIPSVGGYIAGSRELIDALKYNARGFIFSGALPPPQAAAAMAAFDVLMDEPEHVEYLRHNTQRYTQGLRRAGFAVHDFGTPIVPIPCPDERTAFEMTRVCLEEGVLVYPIVYPAVPMNQPRIRTFITAGHSDADIDFAVAALAKAARRAGLLK